MRALNCYWEEEDGGGDDDEEFVNLFGVKIRAGSVEAINRKVEMHTRRMEIQQRGRRGKCKDVLAQPSTVHTRLKYQSTC
jgi:hypothetical protein